MYDNQAPQQAAALLALTQCRHGHMLYFPHDIYIGGSLDRYGEYCEMECEFLCKMLFPNDVVVEAGANIGALTLGMARKVGLGGRVFAYEPQRVIFTMLCANSALNGAWNIIARQQALGGTHATLGLPFIDYTQPNNFGDYRLLYTQAAEMVECVRIDSLNLDRCRLIKIDVQGMEAQVLAGATETIARCKPFLYVENDDDTSLLPEMIREFGYDVYEHKTPLFNPNNYKSNPHNSFTNIVSFNVLGVPHEYRPTVKVELKPWRF